MSPNLLIAGLVLDPYNAVNERTEVGIIRKFTNNHAELVGRFHASHSDSK
jgi:hypothetical protein